MSSDKGTELIRLALKKASFVADISEFREKYNIPSAGFDTWSTARFWLMERTGMLVDYSAASTSRNAKALLDEKAFFSDLANILGKYKLPPTLILVLQDYIAFPASLNDPRESYFGCTVESPQWTDTPLSNEESWKDMGIPYVRLLIHSEATKSDVKKSVDSQWRLIRALLADETRKTKTNRKRIRTKADRDERIFQLSQMSRDLVRKELPDDYKEDRLAKDVMIALVVQKEFGTLPSASGIRKIVQLEKKRREM